MRPVHGGCWWALGVLVVASVVWAGPAAAETTLEVEAGYAGWFVPGEDVPVRVRISADRLLRGSLEVGVGTTQDGIPVAVAVEVPGGSQKEFLVIAPGGLAQNPDVTALLRQDDRVLASAQTSILGTSDTELVGVLPGALRGRPLPGTTALAVDAGTARFAAVGEAELETAPASLGPLSTLITDPDELGRLSPAARTGVLRWVEDGGRLLVDSAKGQAVPGLPDAWQPGARGRAQAGLGEVVATGGAVAAGRWSGLVEPSGWGSGNTQFGGAPLAASLASDAGLRTPELGWLVGFLAVYVLVVGPVLFFAVRRRGRPELAWVAVPLVAVLFSGGSYAVGSDLRSATQLVHASVVSSGTMGPSATSYIGVFSRSGETVRVGFPEDWANGPYADVGDAPRPALLTRTPAGPEARLPLDAGQFGIARGSGPVPQTAGLEISAAGGVGGRVTGSVRNTTPFRLDDVAVFLGSEASLVGALGPDEQREFTVAHTGAVRGDTLFRVWAQMRSGTPEGMADATLWQMSVRYGSSSILASNAIVAAGWTRDFVPDVRVNDRARRPEGRTLVLGRQTVRPSPDSSLSVAVRQEVVRDPFVRGFPGQRTGSVVRFVLPEGAETSRLVLKNPFGSAELWQDGAWQQAACTPASCVVADPRGGAVIGCPPGGPCPPPPPIMRANVGAEFVVPAAAVRDGVVYARVPGPASAEPGLPLGLDRAL